MLVKRDYKVFRNCSEQYKKCYKKAIIFKLNEKSKIFLLRHMGTKKYFTIKNKCVGLP